ncbi:MAG: DUF3568 domain-containing protein [Candidatus Omnitrophica bacterium]|nr:DUF3568 domain-containing protein [Candidatus Omnitrophota bacterium]
MVRKIMLSIVSVLFLVNMCGCAVLIGGAAGATGTSKWLSGKLTQRVDVSSEKSLSSVKSALKSLRLNVSKETITDDMIQIKSNYSDGKTIWIDIRPLSSTKSQIDVRVGAVSDREAAQEILDRILKYL